jgi:hypothetical protein
MSGEPINVLEIAARKGSFVVGKGWRNEQLRLRCTNLVAAGLMVKRHGEYIITDKGRKVLAEDTK